jgi:hypothetical protein
MRCERDTRCEIQDTGYRCEIPDARCGIRDTDAAER